MLAVIFGATVGRIIDVSGIDNAHEVVNILHRQGFNMALFKGLMKGKGDGPIITEAFIINKTDSECFIEILKRNSIVLVIFFKVF